MKPELKTKFLGLFDEVLGQKTKDATLSLFGDENGTALTGDDADLATEVREASLQERLDQRDAMYVKKVKEAKDRILDGTYGQCDDCGSEISYKRLIARPTATMCIACKEDQEHGELGNIHNRRDLKESAGDTSDLDNVVKLKKFGSITDIKFESIVDNF